MNFGARPAAGLRIRAARVDDAAAISTLVMALADRFLDDPASEAARPFLATIGPDATLERLASPRFEGFVAEDGSGLCGVILMRDGTHLYHLFVREDRQRLGIADRLWRTARRRLHGREPGVEVTVNAALAAVGYYERLGFEAAGMPQQLDGTHFLPMRLALRDRDD